MIRPTVAPVVGRRSGNTFGITAIEQIKLFLGSDLESIESPRRFRPRASAADQLVADALQAFQFLVVDLYSILHRGFIAGRRPSAKQRQKSRQYRRPKPSEGQPNATLSSREGDAQAGEGHAVAVVGGALGAKRKRCSGALPS